MKKIINLAFLAATLLWANTADAMRSTLRFLGQEVGNGAKSVPSKLNWARYSQGQSFKGYVNPTTGGEHKANLVVIKPSEEEPEYFENRPEYQAAS